MTAASVHTPVLLQEAISYLNVRPGGTYVDATCGGGGHSQAICQAQADIRLVCLDVDPAAIARTRARLSAAVPNCAVTYINRSFADLAAALEEQHISSVAGVLFDFGLSSDQLQTSGRGFSFQADEPLVMTLSGKGRDEVTTAYDVVNTWEEESLTDIISGFGEERFAKRIAGRIVSKRKQSPIETTGALYEIIHAAIPERYRKQSRIDPATKTFQAIRMAVNAELPAIAAGLDAARQVLAPDGRIVTIAFHSLEDRIVKRTFRTWEEAGYGNRMTKKPVTASAEEEEQNPRARSAKLRAFNCQK